MPLKGVTVLDIGGGVAGAYCTKLLRDMGASVWRYDLLTERTEDVDAQPTDETQRSVELFDRYLNAGKQTITCRTDLAAAGVEFDLVIVGEAADRCGINDFKANVGILDISWFGHDGPYASWQGSDLIVQALAGIVHPLGPKEGPPLFPGEHQATLLAGVSAYCTVVAQLVSGRPSTPVRLELSILESILVLSELQICNAEQLGISLPRLGVNRFLPTCPVSIHCCKQGWIGITPLTPAQWRAFCGLLGRDDMAEDPDLLPARTRFPFADRIEAALDECFPRKSADEWAALGRELKIPMVVVPNAEGILEHPIFNARESFAEFQHKGRSYRVPRTPLRLERTPPRSQLDAAASTCLPSGSVCRSAEQPRAFDSPLDGIRVVDFSMGWAGPLATRILADLGAEVIKIEAGRYPDWWRSVDWSPEAIARKQFEESRHFSALNRGKASVSLDLTQAQGRALAMRLVSQAQVVVENQAAGVMDRLGLGYQALSAERDDLVMLSMSAFGAGNAWSDTRAYGSVLDQGSGLPSFVGEAAWPPTLAHIAYGDPVGGVYGAAALLTALFHRARCGEGQWINNTQIEAMLPFTSAALLTRQATGQEPTLGSATATVRWRRTVFSAAKAKTLGSRSRCSRRPPGDVCRN